MKRETIKEKRVKKGLSQAEVAKRAGIKYSTYVKKERGERKWLYCEVFNICNKVFKCTMDEIEL